jgi:transposase
MKKNKDNYNKLKNYWKNILKSRLELDCSKWKRYKCFKELTTEQDIVDYLVSLDKEFEETYQVYQNLLYSFQNNNINTLEETLNNKYDNISDYMIISIKTIKSYINYIKNTFNTKYNNGYIEGNNNFIKALKRIAFGFRSFIRFKARIMICKGLINPKEKEVENLPFSTS